MTEIQLPLYGIRVQLDGQGGGRLLSHLHYHVEEEAGDETDEQLHTAVDAIESMILGHACAGLDITTPAYLAGIETAVETVFNKLAE